MTGNRLKSRPNRPILLKLVSFGASDRIRAAVIVAVIATATPGLGATHSTTLHAQEMPAGVASELVEEALDTRLDPPPAASIATPRQWAPPALAWFAIALGATMLIVGWRRGELSRASVAPSSGGSTRRPVESDAPNRTGQRRLRARRTAESGDDARDAEEDGATAIPDRAAEASATEVPKRNRRRSKPSAWSRARDVVGGIGLGRGATTSGSTDTASGDDGGDGGPQPSAGAPPPELVLPFHVTEILERAAARRAAEKQEADPVSAHPPDAQKPDAPAEDDPTPPTKSLDFLVPGYDPWKAR